MESYHGARRVGEALSASRYRKLGYQSLAIVIINDFGLYFSRSLPSYGNPSSQLPPLRKLDTLRKRANPCIEHIAVLLELDTFFVEVCQRNGEGLDELSRFKLRLWVLILWQRHVDCYLNHPEVRVAEARI